MPRTERSPAFHPRIEGDHTARYRMLLLGDLTGADKITPETVQLKNGEDVEVVRIERDPSQAMFGHVLVIHNDQEKWIPVELVNGNKSYSELTDTEKKRLRESY